MLSNHITYELSAYANGELSCERSREVAEHIMACAECRAEFEVIKLGVKLAQQLPQVAAPERMWNQIEAALARQPVILSRRRPSFWRPQYVALAACLIVALVAGALWFFGDRPTSPTGPSWQVATLNGTPTIGSTGISKEGRLGVGQWLETDQNSRAQISVASIGQVEVDPNTRIKLVETQPTEHRLELARGRMSARIWAPPRLFFVDTPSAVAADMGCAYTLDVDESGGSLLRVTSGWVALQLKDRESIVPAGAACQTRSGIGPGTPYFEDADADFRRALAELDFGTDASGKAAALSILLQKARLKDTLTLWHLLARVEGDDRRRVYEKTASLVTPPEGVTREGVLKLDQTMLETWREKLERDWTSSLFPKSVSPGSWKSGQPISAPKLQRK